MTSRAAFAAFFTLFAISQVARAAGNDEQAPQTKPLSERDPDDVLHFDLGPVAINPVLLVQVQAAPYAGADARIQTGDVAERPGFRMRRGRLGVAGTVLGHYPFALTGELASIGADGNVAPVLHDAWIGWERCACFAVYAGFEDVPFSRYAMTNAGEGALIERPFAVNALAPFHQLGAHLESHLFARKLGLYLGAYNAFQRTNQFFLGYLENPAPLGNRFDGLAGVARVEVEPLGSVGTAIEDLDQGPPKVAIGVAGFLSNGGTKTTIGTTGDVLLHVAGLHMMSSILVNKTDPKSQPTQPTTDVVAITSYGFVGEAGYTILRRRLGVAARFEWINPNTRVADQQDGWALGGGASYHVIANEIKANLDYTHREERHGASLKNDTVALQFQVNLGAHRAVPQ